MGNKLLIKSEDGNSIVYDGFMMLAYIPMYYFDRGMAYEGSDGYSVYGVFRAYHFTEDTTDITKGKPSVFEIPMMIDTKPYSITKETIDIGFGVEDYKVFKYYNGSLVLSYRHLVGDVSNVEKATNLVFEGKMDGNRYGDIANIYNKAKIINKASLKVPAFYEQTAIATTYRTLGDISEEARFSATPDSVVVGIDTRMKAPMTNVFSGLCHEDISLMVTVAHNKDARGIVDEPNAIEKIARGL